MADARSKVGQISPQALAGAANDPKTFAQYAGAQNQPGWVTPAAWKAMLQAFTGYGLTNYNPNAASNDYANEVDMSYFTTALKDLAKKK